ncbi:M23 family metallopeptidase [Bacillus sp. FJAT-44742]|uniref:M23 family metallopeptidase n=1 Tax=Bacillus sp. FJAT-44742 TaxID=2014005 RepID=UPI000C245E44|nr:M23 family metallopeptidase [Bacillus sp. FJAT-44742]
MSKKLSKVKREADAKRRGIEGRMRDREREKEKDVTPTNFGYYPSHDEMPQHEPEFYSWRETEQKTEAQPKSRYLFVMQGLAALCLFLLIGILFKTSHPAFEGAREYIEASYQNEFQFAAVSSWYEERFGEPLALMPKPEDEQPAAEPADAYQAEYAVPASGKVTESFTENGKGIMLETIGAADVEAVRGGIVIHAGPHEEWELAVAVQHYDGGESWYGMLEEVEVKLYDHIQAGENIGQVNTQEGSESGIFYFALKEEDQYIDPSEVISFD